MFELPFDRFDNIVIRIFDLLLSVVRKLPVCKADNPSRYDDQEWKKEGFALSVFALSLFAPFLRHVGREINGEGTAVKGEFGISLSCIQNH